MYLLFMNTKWTIQTLVASQAKFKIVINSNIEVIIIQLAIYTSQAEGILGRCTSSSSAIYCYVRVTSVAAFN